MFIPIIFSNVAVTDKNKLCIGKSEYIKNNSLALPVFFLLLFLLLACRNIKIGNDTWTYRYFFRALSNANIKDILGGELEVGFSIMTWLIGQVTDNYQIYLALCSALIVIPISNLYKEDNRHIMLKISVFLNMSTFVMMFSGIRQAIAIALGALAYKYVKKKKLWKFLIVTVVAMGMHHSAFMILFMYPLYYARFERKHLVFTMLAIMLCFIYNKKIFSLLTGVLAMFSTEYEDVSTTTTGAFTSLIMFVGFTAFSYIITDEKIMDQEGKGLRNFLLLTVVLQCFAPLHTLSMRMNYYYIIFIPVAISKMLDYSKIRMKKLSTQAEIVMVLFFSIWFVYGIYNSYITGISTLNTVPYVPFWKGNQ